MSLQPAPVRPLPQAPPEIDSARAIEHYPLGEQQGPLLRFFLSGTARADLTASVDDPMPGYRYISRRSRQCVADLPRTAPRQHRRDLSIGRNAPVRDLIYQAIDSRVEIAYPA